ncbi:MAG: ABC transporter ATP-binding protein [Deltaproteobacteria bacterium]|nr:ABC transporter ATP-binding protein [Deltaproteobacteria bacterium]
MKLLLLIVRRYPQRTLLALGCLVCAGLAEGIGISSLLPVIRVATRDQASAAASNTALERGLDTALGFVGLAPTTTTLFTIVFAGIALKAGLVLLANRQVGYAVAHVATTLRLQLIEALLRTRWAYFVHKPVGAIANSVAMEAQAAADAYLHATTVWALLAQCFVFAAISCLVSWRATLGALVVGSVITVLLNRLVRASRKSGRRQTMRIRQLLARLTDTLQAVKPLKAMAREPLIAPVLEGETRRLNQALEREVMARAYLEAFQDPLMMLFLAVALYVGLGTLSMPFADVVILVFLCARIIADLAKVQKSMQRLAVKESAYWALDDLIREARGAVEVGTGTQPVRFTREIRVDHVSFAHDVAPVLSDAAMVIPAGSLTVITGPSGSGKTTLVDLIVGLLQPQAGEVRVDGVPLREIAARDWRTQIGYVPQETLMLHQSVAQNVTLGDPSVPLADVHEALRAAGASEFVAALPEGVDTIVGERGLRLSGGQRQRLALARALVRKPALLVLDEATTALDPATEREICATLRALRGAVTLVAICHHGHLIDVADLVYHVDDGRIALARGALAERRDVARG